MAWSNTFSGFDIKKRLIVTEVGSMIYCTGRQIDDNGAYILRGSRRLGSEVTYPFIKC